MSPMTIKAVKCIVDIILEISLEVSFIKIVVTNDFY